jgi:hypothetical protein
VSWYLITALSTREVETLIERETVVFGQAVGRGPASRSLERGTTRIR